MKENLMTEDKVRLIVAREYAQAAYQDSLICSDFKGLAAIIGVGNGYTVDIDDDAEQIYGRLQAAADYVASITDGDGKEWASLNFKMMAIILGMWKGEADDSDERKLA